MGDHNEPARVRAPALLEVAREPRDALDVEVVGGLIQEDDVVVADEQRRERDPSALPTREIGDTRLPRDIGDESLNDVAHPSIPRPLVLVKVADDGLVHGAVALELIRLVEHREGHPAPPSYPTAIGLDATGEEPQQGRLTVAVASDDADAIAFVEADRHPVEDHAGRVFEVQRFSAEEVCHPLKGIRPARASRATPLCPGTVRECACFPPCPPTRPVCIGSAC